MGCGKNSREQGTLCSVTHSDGKEVVACSSVEPINYQDLLDTIDLNKTVLEKNKTKPCQSEMLKN